MEMRPDPGRPYSEKTFQDFKGRLSKVLIDRGIDADTAFSDAWVRATITNYVKDMLMNEHQERIRLASNVNIRLAHIEVGAGNTHKVYPVVFEYRGHHLHKAIYFCYNDDKTICVEEMLVNESKLII